MSQISTQIHKFKQSAHNLECNEDEIAFKCSLWVTAVAPVKKSVKAMSRIAIACAGLLIYGTSATSAWAGYDCPSAISDYDSAISDVSFALRRYSSCLQYSDKKDDCSTEFWRLKNAQSDLESAVSDISSYCRE